MSNSNPKIFTVHELSQQVKRLLEDEVGRVWVEGEISGYRPQASGHMYFDLKDEQALINVCLFRGNQAQCKVLPENGKQVKVFGEVSSYPKSSRYQIICRAMEEAGLGRLHQAFEKLKKKLEAEGLFAQEHKKPLPLLPLRIGMVTSPTSAALQDMLQILERRYPNLHIRIAPARVQGQGAADEIAAGIQRLHDLGNIDVIIVGRGGGSMEDLWAFNEEVVARAVYNSNIPIISAVGHETDFTICDFVADLRAPTPSAAAELVIQQKSVFEDQLHDARRRMLRAVQNRLERSAQELDSLQDKLWTQSSHSLQRLRQRLSKLTQRLQQRSPHAQLKQNTERIHLLEKRLHHSFVDVVTQSRRRIDAARHRLQAMNPKAVLTRGYSITMTPAGNVLRSRTDAQPGEEVHTHLQDGCIHSTITQIKELKDDGE